MSKRYELAAVVVVEFTLAAAFLSFGIAWALPQNDWQLLMLRTGVLLAAAGSVIAISLAILYAASQIAQLVREIRYGPRR